MAITAVARKLVTVAFLMLKNNEPYRYARPERIRAKFRELQAAATGQVGPRARGKVKPGLSQVYTDVQLPPVTAPDHLPAGERRMLKDRDMTDFVAELYQPVGTQPPSTESKASSSTKPRRGRPAGRPG